ncbi:TRAP transporter small permease subunit [Halomonas sp. 3H]|uniref:TRAP transporter small permease subunit n=1 Tax=Halomonas sp. 3H TaxID=2952527 RepID=UPI0020B7B9DF|nr:TRAP transporter small permease subunit [Halomonas sp. 3H]
MGYLLGLSRLIDTFNRGVASVAIWCCLAMIVVSFGNASLRRLGRSIGENLTWGTALDLQWVLFSMMFLLVGGYTILTDSNVRVDIVHARLGKKTRSAIEVFGAVCFMLPFSLLVIYMSWPMVANAIAVWERSTLPGGISPWAIKPLVPIAFVLVLLQSVSHAIKHTAFMLGRGPDPHEPDSRKTLSEAD